MPHRGANIVEAYTKTILKDIKSLQKSIGSKKSKTTDSEGKVRTLVVCFEALRTVPMSLLSQLSDGGSATMEISACTDKQTHFSDQDENFHALNIVLFRLGCKFGSKTGQELTRQAHNLIQQEMEALDYVAVLTAYEDVLTRADHDWRSSALSCLLRADDSTAQSILLLQRAVKTLSKDVLESNNIEVSGVRIFKHVLRCASTAQDNHASRLAWQTLAMMIREQSFLVNQHVVEQTTSRMTQTLASSDQVPGVFMDLTKVLEAFFSHHRSRLQGRFHLLLNLFQAFVTSLFRSSSSSPPELGIRQARSLARLLESFCNPPHPRHRGKTSALVDEARKAQAHAGQYAQYILHQYCALVLTGTLESSVREALTPGIWSLIEAIEVNNSEGIKVLSAAMNNSERAVLRSVYDDWKRFGKWEGL